MNRSREEGPVFLTCVAGWKCTAGDRASYIDYVGEMLIADGDDEIFHQEPPLTTLVGC
jgi:hypothetical protein